MKKWLKRIGLGTLALFVLAIAGGAITEQLARRRAAQEFPPPGKMVDIGGRRIQIDCRGTGSPTVVFESGSDTFGSLSWTKVQDKVAATTRACSYSRAGIMWSDPADRLPDDKAVADDLHAMLQKAGEHAPFVLVGHSLGGLYAVAYVHYFGAEIAGLVLVDPAHPDAFRRLADITHGAFNPLPTSLRILSRLSWTGLLRQAPPKSASKEMREMIAYEPTSLSAMVKEAEAFDKVAANVRASHDLGVRPVYLLTSEAPFSGSQLRDINVSPAEGRQFNLDWKAMHDDMATWSRASQHLLVPDSSHFIQVDRPDVVIHAIISVVAAVRNATAPQL